MIEEITAKSRWLVVLTAVVGIAIGSAAAQESEDSAELEYLKERFEALGHRVSQLQKSIDDVLWYHKVGDLARIDKLYIVGPPRANEPEPTAQGAGNPVRFPTYMFWPKRLAENANLPLLVLPHGGVHSNFNTFYAHIIRELVSQGYAVVCPEYRGSTGYGGRHYELIDYGGLEVEDALASRNYAVKNYPFIDPDRVGILGWSHGGLITLLNIFHHPDEYRVAFAGVPVSDLIARMGYKTQRYRDLYSVDYHIGKSAYEDVEEYRRRSPAWHAEKLQTPLLIHTTTNDEDVNVFEVEHLIKSLKAAGKKFEYEIFEAAPGGHTFDRIDTLYAKEARLKIYAFLARHLQPERPITNLDQIYQAAYQ